MTIKPKKSLGQNFLIDQNIINKISNLIRIKNKVVLEIGPGTGNLTSQLLKKKPKKIIVVEKDNYLAQNPLDFKGLMAKFLQNPNLKKELLQTGTMLIVEHTKNDDYWGDGGDGNGLNRLGLLLMEVRSKLRSIHNDADLVFPPWIAFPGIDQADMFWRMGLGEEYMTKWSNYFKSITTKKEYKIAFPQPNDWDKFYQYSV